MSSRLSNEKKGQKILENCQSVIFLLMSMSWEEFANKHDEELHSKLKEDYSRRGYERNLLEAGDRFSVQPSE